MYSITYTPGAIEDYEKSIIWYGERSVQAAEKFMIEVQGKLEAIKKNPKQYPNKYKHYYESSLWKYPFSIIYTIDEKAKQIRIMSIFHHKRNPTKKYKNPK